MSRPFLPITTPSSTSWSRNVQDDGISTDDPSLTYDDVGFKKIRGSCTTLRIYQSPQSDPIQTMEMKIVNRVEFNLRFYYTLKKCQDLSSIHNRDIGSWRHMETKDHDCTKPCPGFRRERILSVKQHDPEEKDISLSLNRSWHRV